MSETDRLVKMANQIMDNFRFHDDAAERFRDHLARFWAPSMIRALREHAEAGGEGLGSGIAGVVRKMDTA
jgi:hypothetical protein